MRKQTPAEVIEKLLRDRDRSFAWLARETGVPYKRLLREVKHQTTPLSFYHAALIADALDVNIAVLTTETRVEVAA